MKERIISAFMDLSSTMGFYNVTMDELANRAGMSKRTIYRYFHSKEEIIEAVLDEFMSKVAGGIGQIIAKEKKPAAIIAGMVHYITQTAPTFINPLVLKDLKVHYPELWQKIDRFRAEKIQGFIRFLVKGEQKEELRDIDPRIFTAAFIASIQAVINPVFILDNDLTFDEAVKQLVELFVHGFLKEK
ncbi:TetR/AcrR family transcriptional regulator [Desulfotruncus alcoholivorax]|uniref:TetR/AcrR family transcriptional regulator n=1 Tax=Desulfotruncus alcoholivorax TaxID=265477 RepID=UPI000401B2CB|nr:TetR/AcrR family transcriptional regulator [Desulfotruncus alcoholivorax]